MCGVGCARILLFIFNFVFWLAGGGLLGIGIWMKVDETIVNYLKVVNIDQSDPLIEHAATLFIVVGAYVFIVGFLGCCGALRKSQSMLFLYAVLVALAMILQIIAAVLALIYKTKVEDHLQDSMSRQVREEYVNGSATADAWDYLQTKLKCCGATGYKDYELSYWWNETRTSTEFVPVTCCVLKNDDPVNPKPLDLVECQKDAGADSKDSDYLEIEGCYESLIGWFKTHSLILMALGFGIGAIQIFGLVAACCLRSALRNEKD